MSERKSKNWKVIHSSGYWFGRARLLPPFNCHVCNARGYLVYVPDDTKKYHCVWCATEAGYIGENEGSWARGQQPREGEPEGGEE